jgi:thioredoxin reductase (NADPH)
MHSVFVIVGTPTFDALLRDLARTYHEHHVIRCERGDEALATLAHFQQQKVPVALVIAEQRLAGEMSGIAFLAQVRGLMPSAKLLLITGEREELPPLHFKIDAILQNCFPPEDSLFPIIDALLEQSRLLPVETTAAVPADGIRVIGHRWSNASHQVKDFLARHAVPFQWVDVETHPEVLSPGGAHGTDPRLPIVEFADGSTLVQPRREEIAAKLGLCMHAEHRFYDLVIVGAGPSGLAAAIYGASEGLRTAVIEQDVPGGQAGMSSRIENYPGFPMGLSGADLARRSVAQAARFGAELLSPQTVTGIRIADPYRFVTLAAGLEIGCYVLLLAMGVSYRRLRIPGIDQLTGTGVYYGAAISEAVACQGKHVYIVGGANSAGQAALYFADYARRVTILVRGASLSESMSSYLMQEIAQRSTIDVQTHTEVASCIGKERLEQLCLIDNTTGARRVVSAEALFIFIGASPHTEWLPERVAKDQAGFILTGADVLHHGWSSPREPLLLESSVPGIFVAGDVRAGSVKRVASAVGEGAVAIALIHQYLQSVR